VTERNPILRRLSHSLKQSKGFWQSPKKEKNLAKRVGGRTTSASGSKGEKGDVRKVGIARLEHKITERKSFSVTREMVEKIVNASIACEEIAAIVVEFIDGVTGKSEGELAIIPIDDLIRLLQDDSK